jgi:hypothetical protein
MRALAIIMLFAAVASGNAQAQQKGVEPYQQLIFVSMGDPRCSAEGCDIQLPPIPTGKRLVVQHISGSAVLLAGFAFTGTLRTGDFNSNSVRIQLIPNFQPISAGTLQLVTFSQAVSGYVFAGQRPYFQFGATGAGLYLNTSVEVSLSGYLEADK